MRALVLIPCSGPKCADCTAPTEDKPIPGIVPLRRKLLALVRNTPTLENEPSNRKGILATNAGSAPAYRLYQGKFYQKCNNVLGKNYDNIDVLIVSSLYGLIKPNESVQEYELRMDHRIHTGESIYKFWQEQSLHRLLHSYVQKGHISFIWSLLPDSPPKYLYNSIFNEFWNNTKAQCYRVNTEPTGSVVTLKRGEWLNAVLATDPTLLHTYPIALPEVFEDISGVRFLYKQLP